MRYWLTFLLIFVTLMVAENFKAVSESYVGCRLMGRSFDVCVIGALEKADL